MFEPILSFGKAHSKIEWANKHIDNLESLHTRYIHSDMDLTITHSESDGRQDIGLARVQAPPEEMALILGDAIHNLRSALDYCWMGLARAADPNARGKLTLPIADNKKGLVALASQSAVGAAFPAAIGLVADTICTHSDFDNGGNKPLVILNRLSNWEKHNLIVLTWRKIFIGKIRIGNVRIEGATIIGEAPTYLVRNFGPAAEMQTDDKATAEIIFGEHDFIKDEPVFPLVRNIAQATTQAVNAFCEEFAGS